MLIKHISQTKERPGGDFFYLANSRWSGNVEMPTTTIMTRPPLQKLLKI